MQTREGLVSEPDPRTRTSYMRTFPLKVHYKVIEILAMRWLDTRLTHIFTGTILQAKLFCIKFFSATLHAVYSMASTLQVCFLRL